MVLRHLYETIPRLTGYEVEVICVDDHSTEATAAISGSFGAKVIEKHMGRPGKRMVLPTDF